ncbi:cytochrome c biogenesis CcdA family protein [Prosthecomicrobium sp. N25]|uniref:cytochrome c biogenesis CcdA family protein n=1 Tax=Prosthecomicrobium sp. N25 TaxID=3129254 RepID=UPI0030777CC9
MDFDVSLPAAFAAGLASFLSPCVLPLVPPYLCFLAGMGMEQLAGSEREGTARLRLLTVAVAFVLGFGTVFVALGATASQVGRLLAEHLRLLTILSGVAVGVMGLHFLGVLRIGLLHREARLQVDRRPAGLAGAYLVGLAFGFGWTPCVGPVLTTILLVAAQSDGAAKGAGLLAVYAAGIGLPFMAAAAFAGPFLRLAGRFRRYLGVVEKATGGVLVVTGLLFVTGSMPTVGQWLLDTFPALGRIG